MDEINDITDWLIEKIVRAREEGLTLAYCHEIVRDVFTAPWDEHTKS